MLHAPSPTAWPTRSTSNHWASVRRHTPRALCSRIWHSLIYTETRRASFPGIVPEPEMTDVYVWGCPNTTCWVCVQDKRRSGNLMLGRLNCNRCLFYSWANILLLGQILREFANIARTENFDRRHRQNRSAVICTHLSMRAATFLGPNIWLILQQSKKYLLHSMIARKRPTNRNIYTACGVVY